MNNYPSRQKTYRKQYDANYSEQHRIERIARAMAWQKAHPEKVKENNKSRLRRFKMMVFEHYGKHCVCCKETIEEFLTIDHINKNGKEHRESVGSGAAFYKWIVDNNYPSDLRILCMNCNYGERRRACCPHQLDKVEITT